MIRNAFRPRIAKHASRRDRWMLFVLGLASIFEGMVLVLSLGYLTVETRCWVLFELFEDE